MKIADILEIADKPLTESEYLPLAATMESKLRSMVDMLPEIYNGLNSGNYDDLLSKIEKWENE